MGEYSKRIKTRIPGSWGAFGTKAKATLTTALAGTNNDLKYTAKAGDQEADSADFTAGNAVTVAYVVAGNNTALSVDVASSAITVNVATNGGGAATSTAAQVRDAVNGDAEAAALVTAENASGNDGTGVVTALAATPLAGGQNYVIGTSR
jgi:hypothetical protein